MRAATWSKAPVSSAHYYCNRLRCLLFVSVVWGGDSICTRLLSVLYDLHTDIDDFVSHIEFVFHKPYARDESESREFCEALQQHARLAHTRQCSYLLPLVESQHGAAVLGQSSSVVTVKLAVSSLLHISLCVFHR
jgi:hypothetical protein